MPRGAWPVQATLQKPFSEPAAWAARVTRLLRGARARHLRTQWAFGGDAGTCRGPGASGTTEPFHKAAGAPIPPLPGAPFLFFLTCSVIKIHSFERLRRRVN